MDPSISVPEGLYVIDHLITEFFRKRPKDLLYLCWSHFINQVIMLQWIFNDYRNISTPDRGRPVNYGKEFIFITRMATSRMDVEIINVQVTGWGHPPGHELGHFGMRSGPEVFVRI